MATSNQSIFNADGSLNPEFLASVPKFNASAVGSGQAHYDGESGMTTYDPAPMIDIGNNMLGQYGSNGQLTGIYYKDQSKGGFWNTNGNFRPYDPSSSLFGGLVGNISETFSNLPLPVKLAAAYYGGTAIADSLGIGGAASGGVTGLGSASDVAMMYDPVAANIAAGMTPELAAATAAGATVAPSFTTAVPEIGALSTAGPGVQIASTDATAGLNSLGNTGTPLSEVVTGNADKAALYGDAGYGAGMTGAETGAYDAGLAAGGAAAANAAANAGNNAAAKTLTGSALGDMALINAGTGLAGAYLQSNAAQNAADTQTAAANQAIAQQQANFNTINAQQAPYRAAGYSGLNEIAKLSSGQTPTYDYMGNIVKDAAGNPVMQTGSGYLTHQFTPEDFAAGIDPGYDFRLQQGQMANQRAANVGGGALSGNTLKGLQDYTQGLASQEYGNAFGRYQTQRQNIYNTLASIAGIGQTGQNATNTAATNATNAATQLGVGSAAVQAGATKGSATAYGNALSDIGNNYTLASLLNQRGNVVMPVQG